MNIYNLTMFVCKLGTPSCSHYEHFHVYLAYRRQTGTVVIRQTFDRAPRKTKLPTAHISRQGDNRHLLIIYIHWQKFIRFLSLGGVVGLITHLVLLLVIKA